VINSVVKIIGFPNRQIEVHAEAGFVAAQSWRLLEETQPWFDKICQPPAAI
jgi:hypothetical protein